MVHELEVVEVKNKVTVKRSSNLYVLQSKKVKLVATKSGPFSTRTESLLVKWDSPLGMIGSRSFLRQRWRCDFV